MRVLGVAFVVTIVGVAGVGTASTLRDRNAKRVTATSAGNVTLTPEGRSAAPKSATVPAPVPKAPASVPTDPPPAAMAPVASAPAASSVTRGGSTLGQGRTTLTDSIYAVRSGDSVVVNFDTQGGRTRRADKFERMVRSTLPMVYGRLATSVLDSVPEGSLLPSRDVIGALQSQGMRLTLENGVKISVWPQTRIGRDGALVIAYMTVVER